MNKRRSDAELSEHLDKVTQELYRQLEREGALGVVVIVARAENAVVGCASELLLAKLWPAVLHSVASTIGARAEIAAALVEQRARKPPTN